MALVLTIENEARLADGGPLSVTVSGTRGIDIGRASHLDWTLPDTTRTISSHHCEIRFRDNAYWLNDISANGTFVNGSTQRVQSPYRLRHGDKLEIGHYIIGVAVEGEVAAAPERPEFTPSFQAERRAGGADYWDNTGDEAPPIARRDLMPQRDLKPVRPDFVDWAVDIPAPTGDNQFVPGAPPSPRPVAPPPRGSGEDFAWAPYNPTPQPQAPEPAPIPAPRRPQAEPGSALAWSAPPPAGDAWGEPAPAGQGAAANPFAASPFAPEPGGFAPLPPIASPGAAPASVWGESPASGDAWGSPPPAAQPAAPVSAPGAMPVAPVPPPVAEPPPWQGAPAAPMPEIDRHSAPTPVPVFEPSPPAPAAPAALPVSGGASAADFVRRFARGAGIPEESIATQDAGQLAEQLGRLMRMVSTDVKQLLNARAETKRIARSTSHTMIQALDNNPLKFSPTIEDALRIMFGRRTSGYLDAPRAFEDSFKDLKAHQVKTYAAMQQALRLLIEDISPEAVLETVEPEKGIGALVSSRKAKLWDAYVARWNAKTAPYEDGMVDAFMIYFAECYDRGGRSDQ